MVAVLFTVEVDFAQHEVAAEEIVQDKAGDVAMAPRRVLGTPRDPAASSAEHVSAAQLARTAKSISAKDRIMMASLPAHVPVGDAKGRHAPGVR